jgi:hypothetical protein
MWNRLAWRIPIFFVSVGEILGERARVWRKYVPAPARSGQWKGKTSMKSTICIWGTGEQVTEGLEIETLIIESCQLTRKWAEVSFDLRKNRIRAD